MRRCGAVLLSRRGLSSAASRQLLHVSRLPTFHFQASLPKMPVPALEKTMQRFLYYATPLVRPSQTRLYT